MRYIVLVPAVLIFVACAPTANSTTSSDNRVKSGSCNSGVSCQNIGLSLASRYKYKEASKYFKRACEYGVNEGCNNLAFQYANAEGLKQSYTLAYKYWGMACDMGNSSACANLQLAKDKVEELRNKKGR